MASLIEREKIQPIAQRFDQKQIDILKNSICKGVSNDEFEIFLMACAKTQLDPFMRQIYAVKRKSKKPDGTWGESMTIQTGIDGYRLIAERTGCYAPGQEPTYTYDDKGSILCATAYVKKLTKDGTWHTLSAHAYMDEYCQTYHDKQTGQKKPTGMWVNMPRTMLAKCAEALALRKAFPAEMSGIYTKEEMSQADVEDIAPVVPLDAQIPATPKITSEELENINYILDECDPRYKNWVIHILEKNYNIFSLKDLTPEIYAKILPGATQNKDAYFFQKPLDLGTVENV